MSQSRFRILLVEDDPIEADLITAELGGVNTTYAEVRHHDRLRSALTSLIDEACDVVLLDLNLPDGYGVDNLHRLLAIAPQVPIIILTNLENEESAAEMLAEGAQDYLIKRHITGELLRRAIRYAIARHTAEASLRLSQERYALALAGARDGIWDWDLVRNEIHFSTRWFELLQLGDDRTARPPSEWFDRVSPDDRAGLDQALRAHLRGDTPYLEHEHRITTGAGNALWVLCRGIAVRDQSGRASRLAGSMTDISDRKFAEARLMYEALHDTLTGLPNRALFLDRLEVALKQQRRDPVRAFAVLFLDIDGFKTTNDSLGHTAGDELLVQFGNRLRALLRPGDTIARLGGDEFAILLTDVATPQEVTRVAERIHETLALKFMVAGKELYAGASLGIALSNRTYERSSDLLRDADAAMYQSKSSLRGSYTVFDRVRHEAPIDRLELETDLRSALRQNQMQAYYQPIVSLDGLQVLGFEALLRWLHPARGVIAPGVFIPLAEKCGTIGALSWWVMHEACRQTREWQLSDARFADLTVSVNVSSRLLSEPHFAARTAAVLEKTGLAPHALHLELTEDVLLHHEREVINELQMLHRLGVKLHLDDFGTGYSSLAYLNRFDYDTIKIDRSFLAGGPQTSRNRRIVDAVISLAAVLGIDVIAEGVETPEQADNLRALNCRAAQGFLFSQPVPATAAGELLVRGHGVMSESSWHAVDRHPNA